MIVTNSERLYWKLKNRQNNNQQRASIPLPFPVEKQRERTKKVIKI